MAGLGGGAAGGVGGDGGAGAAGGGGLAGGEELPGAPQLPADVVAEAIPGNIRNAELFVRFMKHVVRYLRVSAARGVRFIPVPAFHSAHTTTPPQEKIKVSAVESEQPPRFLHAMSTKLAIDVKPLKFAYTRLNSLLRTLQVTDVDQFGPIQLVADFTTLLATYPNGFMVITEPYNARTPHIPDPIMQLACLGEGGPAVARAHRRQPPPPPLPPFLVVQMRPWR